MDDVHDDLLRRLEAERLEELQVQRHRRGVLGDAPRVEPAETWPAPAQMAELQRL